MQNSLQLSCCEIGRIIFRHEFEFIISQGGIYLPLTTEEQERQALLEALLGTVYF